VKYRTWIGELMAPIAIARYGHGTTFFMQHVYVFGGTDSLQKKIAKNEAFAVESNTWKDIQELPTPAGQVSAAVFRDKIYLSVVGDSDL
jgi:hypothetical protein